MKKYSLITILLSLLVLTSCSEQMPVDDQTNIAKNEYTKFWVKKFGLIDGKQNWNMATSADAAVNPAAYPGGAIVKIYSNSSANSGKLIGYATKAATLKLDVAKGSKDVYAEILDKNNNVISAGLYDISEGKIKIDGSTSARPASRAGAVSRDEATPTFDWIIACEDLGTVDDYDFNDIVLGINAVAREGYTQVKITPLAAGGTIAATIYLKDEELGEIHNLIIEGTPTTTMLNTTTWDVPGESISRNLTNWSMSDIMGNITIAVAGHGNASTTIITPPNEGEAPQMICVAGDWKWPSEREGIDLAYLGFKTWASTPEDEMTDAIRGWSNNPNSARQVISWSIPEDVDPDPDPTVDPNDPNDPDDPNDDPNEDVDPYEGITKLSYGMIESQGQSWSSGWTHASKKWDYVPGLVTKSMLAYCEQYDEYDDNAFTWAKGYADKAYNGNTFDDNAFVEGQLDNIASGKVVLSLYRMAKEGKGEMTEADATKYKNAADKIYNYLRYSYPRIADGLVGAGGFYHKYSYEEGKTDPERKSYTNQMWLDGLYMGAAFYAEYLATFPETADVDGGWADIYNQFNIIHTHTYDSNKQLNYHGWATTDASGNYNASSFWANRAEGANKGCSKEFWGRGIGWYFAALVDVLEYMPKTNANYNNLKAIYLQVAAGLKRWQDQTSGVWYQLVQYDSSVTASSRYTNATCPYDTSKTWIQWFDKNSSKKDQTLTNAPNYLEASASCMFTYAFLKGLRLGLLDEGTYGSVAENAYDGINTQFITGSGSSMSIKDICKSAGLGPSTELCRDGSIESYLVGYDVVRVSNEGKGIGPYIFASLEWEKRQAGVTD